jgi:hypothetical protein
MNVGVCLSMEMERDRRSLELVLQYSLLEAKGF